MRIAVIGGGISGISTATLLNKHTTHDVVVIEKEFSIGGKAVTLKRGGYTIETGPNGFLDNKEEIKRMVEEFQFEENIIQSKDESRIRMVYSNSKLNLLPENPMRLLKGDFFSLKGKMRIFKEPFIKPNKDDETLEQFVTRRLGREVLDKLIGPMACGVYAGDPSYMSMDATFSRIKEIERQYGSLIKGLAKLMKEKKANAQSASGPFSAKLLSFKNGVGSFINHLSKKLNIIYGDVVSIEQTDRFKIILKNKKIDVDCVVFAVPSYSLSDILKNTDLDFSKILRKIEYAPLSVVSLGFEKEGMPDIINSFGYLFDLNEIEDVIGVLFDSSIFENRALDDKLLVRVMIGGALRKESAQKTNLAEIATKELQRSANIHKPFEFFTKQIHTKAIPQYGLNHKEILKEKDNFEEEHKGIFITGNAFYGVSLNDCIKSSYRILEKIK